MFVVIKCEPFSPDFPSSFIVSCTMDDTNIFGTQYRRPRRQDIVLSKSLNIARFNFILYE